MYELPAAAAMTTGQCSEVAPTAAVSGDADRGVYASAKRPGGAPTELAATPFRLVEKKFKVVRYDRRDAKRHPKPEPLDMSDVVDFQNPSACSEPLRSMMHQCTAASALPSFTFDGVPGLVFFPNAISVAEQYRWARVAMEEFTQSAQHPNNITAVGGTDASGGSATTEGYSKAMRWATLGFSYNWTAKTYDVGAYSPFPVDLKSVMEGIVRALGQQDGSYEPQTAIVNYFPQGSMMMAHQDVSEVCLERPLISMSLGCSAIFLMGTESRDDAPYAFILRSGDVVAFSGPSRLAFHAVPRILDDVPPFLIDGGAQHAATTSGDKGEDNTTTTSHSTGWEQAMRGLRININVRQVFNEHHDKLFSKRSKPELS